MVDPRTIEWLTRYGEAIQRQSIPSIRGDPAMLDSLTNVRHQVSGWRKVIEKCEEGEAKVEMIKTLRGALTELFLLENPGTEFILRDGEFHLVTDEDRILFRLKYEPIR